MEVILLERVEKLGQMGDVVNVKAGFARNFLLPQKKALRATDNNLEEFRKRRAQLEAENLSRRTEAESIAERLEGLSVVIVRQASDSDQLYGSVNTRDISTVVSEAGFSIGRSQVRLSRPIKTVGLHSVLISLHPEVQAGIIVNVARSMDEAEAQARGERAGGEDDEEETVEASLTEVPDDDTPPGEDGED